MVIETKVVIGWFKWQLKMWLVDLNDNFECDWLIELSDNKISSLNHLFGDVLVAAVVAISFLCHFLIDVALALPSLFLLTSLLPNVPISPHIQHWSGH